MSTDDTAAALGRLVKGEWVADRDDAVCRGDGYRVSIHTGGPGYMGVVINAERRLDGFPWLDGAVFRHPAQNVAEALAGVCCQPLAVAILHGLDAFPEVAEPDPQWPWWWCRIGGVDPPTYHAIRQTATDEPEFWHPQEDGWAKCRRPHYRWRRAPAPPGWTP